VAQPQPESAFNGHAANVSPINGSASNGSNTGIRFRADKPFRDQVEDAERDIIVAALHHTRDNVTEAARILDLERGHFYKKMKALGLRRGKEEVAV
jgi:DNA-binding NtrC family response regulator